MSRIFVFSCVGFSPDGALLNALSSSRNRFATQFRRSQMDAACESTVLAEQSHSVALVNLASVGSPGGSFFAGGQHGPQECLCTISSLFYSLRRAQQSTIGRNHIPCNGVVVSPKVDIFRHGISLGYSFRKNVVTLNSVISMVVSHDKNNADLTRSVLRSVFVAAFQNHAEVIVWPNFDPSMQSWISSQIMSFVDGEFRGIFREIVFCSDVQAT